MFPDTTDFKASVLGDRDDNAETDSTKKSSVTRVAIGMRNNISGVLGFPYLYNYRANKNSCMISYHSCLIRPFFATQLQFQNTFVSRLTVR